MNARRDDEFRGRPVRGRGPQRSSLVPAGRRHSFLQWCERSGSIDPSGYAPRSKVGEYLGDCFQALLDAAMFASQNPEKAAKSFLPYAPKAATEEDLQALIRYHTHHHHPIGASLKRELKAYADDLKLVSVFKPNTDTTKFADRIYADVFAA